MLKHHVYLYSWYEHIYTLTCTQALPLGKRGRVDNLRSHVKASDVSQKGLNRVFRKSSNGPGRLLIGRFLLRVDFFSDSVWQRRECLCQQPVQWFDFVLLYSLLYLCYRLCYCLKGSRLLYKSFKLLALCFLFGIALRYVSAIAISCLASWSDI